MRVLMPGVVAARSAASWGAESTAGWIVPGGSSLGDIDVAVTEWWEPPTARR
jgi:hypothetical protein